MELTEGYKGISNKEELEKILNKYTEVVNTGHYKIYKKGYGVVKEVREGIYRDCPVYESEEDAYDNLPQYRPNSVAPDKRYLVPEVPTIKVRYHKELCPDLIEMKKVDKGDFIDLRAAETVDLKAGEFKLINLGISIQLPKGYHAEVVPRSSTFKNFGIIMTNSIGIIDESYCGDNDIWRFPALAMRSTHIEINDRICQFRVVKNRDINIEVVDKLDNEDRGGFGTTGKN
jgi:dUTP pyrophosphatase